MRLWEAIGPFFALVSGQPLLPAELLPDEWPFGEGLRLFGELSVLLAPAAIAYTFDGRD